MKTCKDCIHYDVCGYHITEETDMAVEECASGFKDKDRYVERIYGEWVKHRWGVFYCSNCGVIEDQHSYCPHCGAKMKGTRDEVHGDKGTV